MIQARGSCAHVAFERDTTWVQVLFKISFSSTSLFISLYKDSRVFFLLVNYIFIIKTTYMYMYSMFVIPHKRLFINRYTVQGE